MQNRAQLKGSIAKGYIINECLTFCSRYMEGVETKFSYKPRNYTNIEPDREILHIFQMTSRRLGKREIRLLDEDAKAKAHSYVLFNCNVVEPFIT